jgi:pimeloyl-ACP methyl ester carboxylesterase
VSEKDRNPASESPGHRARGVTRGATYEGEHGSEKIARTRVSFESDGVELVGYLHHHPRATGKVLLVILGHGFSGTQDRLFDNAGRFAEAGFAALTFDYRSFGESGGEPRQMVSAGASSRTGARPSSLPAASRAWTQIGSHCGVPRSAAGTSSSSPPESRASPR